MRRKKGVFWGFPGFGDLGGVGGGGWGGAKIRENRRKRGDFLALGEISH